jgi:hypothetical protein
MHAVTEWKIDVTIWWPSGKTRSKRRGLIPARRAHRGSMMATPMVLDEAELPEALREALREARQRVADRRARRCVGADMRRLACMSMPALLNYFRLFMRRWP